MSLLTLAEKHNLTNGALLKLNRISAFVERELGGGKCEGSDAQVNAKDCRRRHDAKTGMTLSLEPQPRAVRKRARPLSRSAIRSVGSSSPAWMRISGPAAFHGTAVRTERTSAGRIRLSNPPQL